MNVKEAYNIWADQYDSNINKTRDLEAECLRQTLENRSLGHCLEIGCGTGKNTEWLLSKCASVTAVDFSEKMLARAREKIQSDRVQFIQADINRRWTFANQKFDLITFSLVLEHVEHLDEIFNQLPGVLTRDGRVYIGELHPFKQYTGSKARFDSGAGEQIVPCFNHHVSDFTLAAEHNGLRIISLKEYFDHNDKTSIPRILSLLFGNK